MNKAIIAIDSFKGCLTSEEAGSAVMEGIKTIFPDCEVHADIPGFNYAVHINLSCPRNSDGIHTIP